MMKMNTMSTNNGPPKWYRTLANLFIATAKVIFSHGIAAHYGTPILPHDHVVPHNKTDDRINDRTDRPEVGEGTPETEAKK